MEDFAKNFLAYEYKLDKKIFMKGGSDKKYIIEYDKKIELIFKKVNKGPDEFEIYLSNDIDDNSCISIQIDKKTQVASIHGISKEKVSCFNHADFILKKPSNFYLEMSIKLLKKYKEKFNINKITLIDNAQIYCDKGRKFNLSQYLLFTNGNTWYEKFGFIVKEKNKREILDKSKKVLKDLKIKDINFKAIFDDIEKNEKSKILNKNLIIQDKDVINKYKDVINKYKDVINKYKDENFMKIFNYIFYANRSDETCLLYFLIAPSLIRQIEKNFSDFTRLEQLEYYLIL